MLNSAYTALKLSLFLMLTLTAIRVGMHKKLERDTARTADPN